MDMILDITNYTPPTLTPDLRALEFSGFCGIDPPNDLINITASQSFQKKLKLFTDLRPNVKIFPKTFVTENF